MKFEIYRTSDTFPFEGCSTETVNWESFDYVRDENNRICQYMKQPIIRSRDIYTIEIESLADLQKLQELVGDGFVIDFEEIKDSSPYPTIEIYDDYRE